MNQRLGFLLLLTTLSISPAAAESRLLVVNKDDHSLSILNAKTGSTLHEIEVGGGPHEVVAQGCDWAAVSNYGGARGNAVTLVDPRSGRITGRLQRPQGAGPHGLAITGGGALLISAEGVGQLLVSDEQRQKVAQSIATEARVSHMVVGDGQRAYLSNIGSGSVTVIDLAGGKIIKQISTGAEAEGIALIQNRDELWVSNRADDNISIIDTGTLEIVATLSSRGVPIRISLSPDQRWAAVSNAASSSVSIFDVATRELLQTIKLDGPGGLGGLFGSRGATPIGTTFSTDGSRLFVALTRANAVAVISTDSWKETARWSVGDNPDGLAYIDC